MKMSTFFGGPLSVGNRRSSWWIIRRLVAISWRDLTGVSALVIAVAGPTWIALAQTPVAEFEWVQQFGTLGPVIDIAQTVDAANGNVYVAGSVGGALPGETSSGSRDTFVRKYDAAGDVLWTRQFGTATISAIAVDSGAVYVTGTTSGTLGDVNVGGVDVFVRKYDDNGNVLWTRQFGTTASDQVSAIAVDASGVYVAGQTSGIFQGQVGAGPDAFVSKFDVSGNELWTRQFGTFGGDSAAGVAVAAGGVYVAGRMFDPSVGNSMAFVRKYDAFGVELWTRQFGAPGFAQPAGIAADLNGAYVVGQTGLALPGQVSAGGQDVFVQKYDADGNEIWTRQFGTAFQDLGFGVAADPSGVYVVGQTSGAPGQIGGGIDAFVRQYDASGNELWTHLFGSPSAERANAVAVDAGGVFVAGQTDGTLPNQVSAGFTDAFVRQYDTLGSELWTHQFGTLGPVNDLAQAVRTDGNGHVYVGGLLGGTLVGDSAADPFVSKYDAGGNELWTRSFGTAGRDQAFGIAVDPTGVYVAGNTGPSVMGVALPGQESAGGPDAFVRKYDADGNELWTRQFGTSGLDQALAIAVDVSGVYVAGQAGPGAGDVGVAFLGQVSAGNADAFVRKYDADGNELWTRQFGTAGFDQALGIDVDSTGVYVVGLTTGAFPNQISAGSNDAFVRKYDTDGNELWTAQFGTVASDFAAAVAVGSNGVYIAGQTIGALPGQASAGFD